MQLIDSASKAGDEKRGYKYMLGAAEGLRNLLEHLSKASNEHASDVDIFPTVVILCGKGNNGGDGLALAHLLSKLNYEVKVYTLTDEYLNEAAIAYQDAIASGIKPHLLKNNTDFAEILSKDKPDYIIDALLGTGAKSKLKDNYIKLIGNINSYKQKHPETQVIAVDIPSGLNADTGAIDTVCVIADHTVCMGYAKLGFAFYPARSVLGELHVRKLDYSEKVLNKFHKEKIYTLGLQDLIELMPPRLVAGSKFDHGTALLIAGSKHMAGAAVLAAGAAIHSGLGMLHIASPTANIPVLNSTVPEAVTHALTSYEDDRGTDNLGTCWQIIKHKEPNAICMGPALSLEYNVQQLVRRILEELEESKFRPSIILDADAINAFKDKPKQLKHKGLDILVTPHYGEFARISPEPITATEIAALSPLEKIALLRKFTKVTGCSVLLKGSPSIVVDAQTNDAFVLPYGNSGLAKAGSGDTLSGIIVSLAAQIACRQKSKSKAKQLSVTTQAAIMGAFILGKTAEQLSKEYGEYSLSASLIIKDLHKVLRAF